MEKVSKNAIITVDESSGFETELQIVEGMQYDKGYISPYFVTNRDTMTIELEDAYVLATDHKINTIQEILPILEKVMETNKPLLLIAEDIENEVTSTLILNKLRGAFNVIPTKAPGFGDNQKEMLEDIAILTNAKFVSKDLNMKLQDITLDDLGLVSKAIIKKDNTTLIVNEPNKEKIDARVEELNSQMLNTTTEFDKEKLQERIAKLAGGVAVIKVGAATETELKEKKLRIEDALNATRAAVEEGIVSGGGTALLNVYNKVAEIEAEGDERTGVNIVLRAMEEPVRTIADNAGLEGSVVVERLKNEEV